MVTGLGTVEREQGGERGGGGDLDNYTCPGVTGTNYRWFMEQLFDR